MNIRRTKKDIKRVAFFGDADLGPRTKAYIMAKKTARLLAENGFIIVNGGGPGIMEAATLGAKEINGKVELSIIDPRYVPGNYEGSNEENLAYAQKVYKEKNIEKRMARLIEIADAFVIFKGGTGTLAEVGAVWEYAKFDYGHHEPLIFVGKEWRDVIRALVKDMNYESMEKRVIMTVDTPKEVLESLKKAQA